MKYLVISILSLMLFSCKNDYNKIEKAFFSNEFEKTILIANETLKVNSNDPEALGFLGQSQIRIGDITLGIKTLNHAVPNCQKDKPRLAWIYLNLSAAYKILGEQDSTTKYYDKCINLGEVSKAYKTALQFSKIAGLEGQFDEWEKIETKNITFHFQPNSVITNKKFYTQRRQDAFSIINEYFNSTISGKIDFYVWNTIQDGQNYGFPILGFAKPELKLTHSHSNQTPGHELTHIITRHLSKSNKLCRFVNEGVASAFDQSIENKMNTSLKHKRRTNFDKNISIQTAWHKPRYYPEWVYYKLAGYFFQQLKEKGTKEEFKNLVVNQTFENAQTIYGSKLDDLIAEVELQINSM